MRNQYQLSEDDPELLSGLTPGSSQQIAPAPPPPVPPPATIAAPAPVVAPPRAVAPAAAPPAAAAPPPQPLPGMPPSVTPDDLAKYIGQKKQQMNRFGPDEQIALQNNLNARRDSLGSRATEGLKGFGDAIMMGVARAGNPGWQQQYNQQENQYAQDQMNTLRGAGEANMKQVEGNMTLDKMDPQSSMSKQAQQTYAPLFKKLGYNPNALSTMSAAGIDNALAMMTQFGGMEIQAKIKEYELAIERARLQAVTDKTSSDEKVAQENQRIQAAKELAGQSDNAHILGLNIPFTKSPTAASEVGTEYLQKHLGTDTSFLKTATNPDTGEKMGWNGKEWLPIK